MYMQSDKSHIAARILLNSAADTLERDGWDRLSIASFFGSVVHNTQKYISSAINSRIGNTVFRFVAQTGVIWAGTRLLDYAAGRRTFDQTFRALPHANTVGVAALRALPQTMANKTKLPPIHSALGQWYYNTNPQLYLTKNPNYQKPSQAAQSINNLVKTGLTGTAAATIGTIALKKTANLLRKITHHN